MVRDPLVAVQGEQCFIGEPQRLWCDSIRLRKDGTFSFNVINGNWRGVYNPQDRTVYINFTKETIYAGPVVWVGMAPFREWQYNAAIGWIEEQVA